MFNLGKTGTFCHLFEHQISIFLLVYYRSTIESNLNYMKGTMLEKNYNMAIY